MTKMFLFFSPGMTTATLTHDDLINELWSCQQAGVGGGKVMHSWKKTKNLLLATSRPWQLTGIVHVLKCPFLHVNVGGDFSGITCGGFGAHQMEICAVLRAVNRKSLYRHDNAVHLRRNGVNTVPEPHSNIFFPLKSKESFPFSLSHIIVLMSGTGYDRNTVLGALIRPVIASSAMTWAWHFQANDAILINNK